MEQTSRNEIEIDLKELFSVLLGRIILIIGVGVGAAVFGFVFSKFVLQPEYKSTTKIYILNKQDNNSSITYSDLQSGTQLTKDYMTLVTSRPVVEQVISEMNLGLKYKDMVNLISVTNPQDTRILSITVTYYDPAVARNIADSIRDAAAIHITEVMNIEQVNVVEAANTPEEASSPNVLRNTAIGGVAGIILVSGIILVRYLLNDTIKSPDDVERYLGISTLSSIPLQEGVKNLKGIAGKKKTKTKAKAKVA
jgi:capsular polysaccharide biosynthesis protein